MSSFENWLSRLITSQEAKILHQRYQIIQLLKTKLTYREIAKNMGISTTTVVRLNNRFQIRKPRRQQLRSINEIKKRKKIPWVIG